MRERRTDELIEEAAEPLPLMALEAVAPTMSSPAMGAGPDEPSEPAAERWGGRPRIPELSLATVPRRRELELAVVIGVGAGGWFADWRTSGSPSSFSRSGSR